MHCELENSNIKVDQVRIIDAVQEANIINTKNSITDTNTSLDAKHKVQREPKTK